MASSLIMKYLRCNRRLLWRIQTSKCSASLVSKQNIVSWYIAPTTYSCSEMFRVLILSILFSLIWKFWNIQNFCSHKHIPLHRLVTFRTSSLHLSNLFFISLWSLWCHCKPYPSYGALCVGNFTVTGGFLSQRDSDTTYLTISLANLWTKVKSLVIWTTMTLMWRQSYGQYHQPPGKPIYECTLIARFLGPTCRPQMGPMLAPWTLLFGCCSNLVESYDNSILNRLFTKDGIVLDNEVFVM